MSILGPACGPSTAAGAPSTAPGARTGDTPGALAEAAPADPSPRAESGLRLISNNHATCVFPPAGPVRCVGSNSEGEIHSEGYALEAFTDSDRFSAADVDAHLGNGHACALDAEGRVRCWGSVNWGRRGDGCTLDSDAKTTCEGETLSGDPDRRVVVELESLPPIAEISGGWDHTCARSHEGEVWCWGGNIDHESGAAEGDAVLRPQRVELPSATALVSGAHHNCILDEQGATWCWGTAIVDGREAGSGDVLPAVRFESNESGAQRRVAASLWGACSSSEQGETLCWGESALDEGGPVNARPATQRQGWLLDGVTRFVGATDYSCVSNEANEVLCWSDDALYTGGSQDDEGSEWRKVALPFDEATGLGATLTAACAWNDAGQLACWGDLLPGVDDEAGVPPGAQLVNYTGD